MSTDNLTELENALIQADLAGDSDAAAVLADEIARIEAENAPVSVASFAEPAMTMLTGAVAEPVAGIAGILSLPFGSERAAENVKRTRAALTYDPATPEGRRGLETLSNFLAPIGDAVQYLESITGEAGYSAAGPVGGAIGEALPTALFEALGLKGLSKTRYGGRVSGVSDEVAALAERSGIDVTRPENIKRLQALTAQQAAEEARRAGLFADLDIPTTRSRITQSQADFLTERRLARDTDAPEAKLLQDRLIEESAGFKSAAEKIMDDLGYPDEAGEIVKEALETRLSGMREAKNAAYQELAELSQGRGLPIAGDEVLRVFDDPKMLGMVGRLDDSARTKINDLMIEYGLDTNPERVEKWLKNRATAEGALPVKTDITPLNVLNAEEFRQAVNALVDPTAPGELNGVAKGIIRGLDDELRVLDEALDSADILGEAGKNAKDVMAAARRARGLARELYSEYSPNKLAGKLTAKKRGSFEDDLVAASTITKKIIGGTEFGAVENLDKLLGSLKKAGPQGQRAIGDIQASVVLHLIEKSTPASGKLAPGVLSWSGVNFGKAMDNIGSKKLRRIFADKPEMLDKLEQIREAGDLRTQPAAVAKASGTADDLINFAKEIGVIDYLTTYVGGIPGAIVGKGVSTASERLAQRAKMRAAQKQINADPRQAANVQQIKRLYPNMSVVLGIGQLHGEKE